MILRVYDLDQPNFEEKICFVLTEQIRKRICPPSPHNISCFNGNRWYFYVYMGSDPLQNYIFGTFYGTIFLEFCWS